MISHPGGAISSGPLISHVWGRDISDIACFGVRYQYYRRVCACDIMRCVISHPGGAISQGRLGCWNDEKYVGCNSQQYKSLCCADKFPFVLDGPNWLGMTQVVREDPSSQWLWWAKCSLAYLLACSFACLRFVAFAPFPSF